MSGLLDKLKIDGSILTNLDGVTPPKFDPTTKLNPKSLVGSQLDLDGQKPNVPGKLPYLDNLPK